MLLKSIPSQAALLGALVVGVTPAGALPVATAYNDVQTGFVDRQNYFVGPYLGQVSENPRSSVVVSGVSGFAQSVIDPGQTSLVARVDAHYYYGEETAAVASGVLNYYFDLHQGATGAVPIRIDYVLSATSSYTSSANAAIILWRSYSFNDNVILQSDYDGPGPNGSNEAKSVHDYHFNALLEPGETMMISLQTSSKADAGFYYSGGGAFDVTAQATADPRISIDPAYLAAHPGVSIDISDGVGNIGPVAAVPEPAGWAMLLGGFALTGWYRARRHRR